MQDKILSLIKQLESLHQIKCLLVVESGSRMWNFHSDVVGNLDKSSDYDVRGVFYFKPDVYLGIHSYPEQIEHYEHTENGFLYMDIVLWDIHKFAKLALNSNPSVYEWLQSDIIYYQDEIFYTTFKQIFMENLCKNALANHYLSMMISNFYKYASRPEVPYKKYLYILRATACFKALIQGFLPEMPYQNVLIYLEPEYQLIMKDLVEKKKLGENECGSPILAINTIYQELYEFKRNNKLRVKPFMDKIELNNLVVQTIKNL